ncbi:MAG: phosphoglycerate kinase, partial [Gemmatimonadetes bacterium]|nr:phosphoglycerate kinase [Gemmatimonadota bacterium]
MSPSPSSPAGVKKQTLADLPDVHGKRVLVRCDLNVPLKDGRVADDTRIVASLPTIRRLVEAGAKVVLMSHLGRPKGQAKPELSLAPVAKVLAAALGRPVQMAPDCVGSAVTSLVAGMKDGDIVLLENLRFHPEEEKNDPGFARRLADLGDLYVSDAFGTVHRAHASTAGIPALIRPAVAGLLLEKELEYLGGVTSNPARPYVAILGGAKISGKIDVLENLFGRVDTILIGGAMANTFFRAQGFETGKSLVEEDRLALAKELLARAKKENVALELPVDCVVATEMTETTTTETCAADAMPADRMMLDVGPRTVARYREIIVAARTVLWNGPMGVFE